MIKLQELRKQARLSQSQLAEKSGVKLRTIQHYECGDSDINRAAGETLMALANAIGCKMEDLLE